MGCALAEWEAFWLLNERQKNVQTVESADAHYPKNKKQLKQQRQQRKDNVRLKNDLILNLRISQEFEFIQFVFTSRNIPNRICKTASKFDKEILKIGRRIIHVLLICRMGLFHVVFL